MVSHKLILLLIAPALLATFAPAMVMAQEDEGHPILYDARAHFCDDDEDRCPELASAALRSTAYATPAAIVCAAADVAVHAAVPALRRARLPGAQTLSARLPLDPGTAEPVYRVLESLAFRAEETGHEREAALIAASASLANACVETAMYDDETSWIDYLEPLAVVSGGDMNALRRIFSALVAAARASAVRIRPLEELLNEE
ncbi:MAG: hypothetical protein AB7P00_20335 [Sandaracinaceae bacterium]